MANNSFIEGTWKEDPATPAVKPLNCTGTTTVSPLSQVTKICGMCMGGSNNVLVYVTCSLLDVLPDVPTPAPIPQVPEMFNCTAGTRSTLILFNSVSTLCD